MLRPVDMNVIIDIIIPILIKDISSYITYTALPIAWFKNKVAHKHPCSEASFETATFLQVKNFLGKKTEYKRQTKKAQTGD